VNLTCLANLAGLVNLACLAKHLASPSGTANRNLVLALLKFIYRKEN
jgi:hypothetical protein